MSAAGPRTDATTSRLGAHTEMGVVRLTVSDMRSSRSFYERALGLQAQDLGDGKLGFGAPGEPSLVELTPDASAPQLDRRATGLFHLAILVPTRVDLARSLARLAQARWPLHGASDHLVSEALYLSDPDGNGIEVYRDRPRAQWRHDERGNLQMVTLALDLRSLAGELADPEQTPSTVAPGTRIGHVHLQVADIDEAEVFYSGLLGFDVTTRGYPGALFVSAGGYHHHIGLNTWHSAGAAPPPPGSIGLRSFDVRLSDEAELDRILGRIDAAGLATQPINGPGALVHDPSGNAVVLRPR